MCRRQSSPVVTNFVDRHVEFYFAAQLRKFLVSARAPQQKQALAYRLRNTFAGFFLSVGEEGDWNVNGYFPGLIFHGYNMPY